MRISNFKNYILERIGVADSTLFYTGPIFNKTWYRFLEFHQDTNDKKLEEDIKISYPELKPFITDSKEYTLFPVTEIALHLNFKRLNQVEFVKKYKYIYAKRKAKYIVGGYATNFGPRSWAGFSKTTPPVRRSTEHGILIAVEIVIDVSPEFDISNDRKKLIADVKETIWHELNHLYEYYNRYLNQSGTIFSRSPNISITMADENKWGIPKDIYDYWLYNFSFYLYASEPQELNAQVQEAAYQVYEHGFEIIEDTNAWKMADRMEKFKSDVFIENIKNFILDFGEKRIAEKGKLDYAGNEDKIIQKIKNMWTARYEKHLKDNMEDPIIPLENIKKMTYVQFIKYFEKRINRSGTYLKRKLGKLSDL